MCQLDQIDVCRKVWSEAASDFNGTRQKLAAVSGCISRGPSHTGAMQVSRLSLFSLTALWSLLALSSPFPGSGEALVTEAREWVSQETGHPPGSIEMVAPDRRVPVDPCDSALQFRFPFKGNQRTVEARCDAPAWKRFIPVKIDETSRALAVTKPFGAGHTLLVTDLRLIPYAGRSEDIFTDPRLLDGLVLREDVDANTVVERSMVIDQVAIFLTERAYEAGESIQRADLTRIETESPPKNALGTWPSGVVTASQYIEPRHTLLSSDIERSEYVVTSATNIVRGQVITGDMVERTLRPRKQIGAQTLSTLDEAIGLEATRTIRAGTTISLSDLTAADLVRKGEKVTLTVERGALTITVDTIAIENGKMGEQVELTNAESGKVIRGIVIGRHQAKGIAP